ncbi:parB-like partition protein [gamma proteobacterium BDW918]|nr:parB-like partition protein [gamma proteobacterium BDW918]
MVRKSRKSLEGLPTLTSSSDVQKRLESESQSPVAQPIPRKPSPAFKAAEGERIVSSWDKLNAQLEEERAAREAAEARAGLVTIKMPVTGQTVEFRQQEIDVDLIDVPEANGRFQSLLDELSLSDILPSIRREGQQRPGYLAPKPDGRFDSLDGSRRLAACKIAGIKKYIALVGEVPEADREKFSQNENKNSALSYWEQARIYGGMIERGDYKSWNSLGGALDISPVDVDRYKKLYELPELYPALFVRPTDMQKSFGEVVAALRKKNEGALIEAAEELRAQRKEAVRSGEHWKDAADILKALKSAVRTRAPENVGAKARKPKLYSVGPGAVPVKHSKSKTTGAIKFEINPKGLSADAVAEVEMLILKALGQVK